MQISRRRFMKCGVAAMAGVSLSNLALSSPVIGQSVLPRLPVVPLQDLTGLTEGRHRLTLQKSLHDFGTGARSNTLGINSDYLGPVLRVRKGQSVPFDVVNGIDEAVALHWHGLHIPGDVDGGPHQEIAPGQHWQPYVPITQRASMNWFHAHTHGRTAQQTYHGLAGVMLVEDDESLSADLPQTYGVDDLTIVLQDKSFDSHGRMDYTLTGEVFEDGFTGDTLVLNGAIAPLQHQVPQGLVRLRLLNACNARFLTVSLAQGPVTVIASDGGFLNAPVQADSITMSPGERYEILLDMKSVSENSLVVGFDQDGDGDFVGFVTTLFGGEQVQGQLALRLVTDATLPAMDASMPTALANIPVADSRQARRYREFHLNMNAGEDLAVLAANWGNFCGNAEAMAINNRPMNMSQINEVVKRSEPEIWRIAADDMLHPFHVHGCSFRILRQNGSVPPAYAAGWKDMVHVEEGWSEILVQFDHVALADAPYMYHCHILEHEDCGMMGQFTVS